MFMNKLVRTDMQSNTLALQREIAKYEEKIKQLHQKMRELELDERDHQLHLGGLMSALKIIGKSPSAPKQQDLREGTEVSRVRDIIKEANTPLHINAITEKLGETGREKRLSLSGTLNSYAKDGRVFSKAGPNTYGLLEFLGLENKANSGEENKEVYE
jgi:hypothetical protein